MAGLLQNTKSRGPAFFSSTSTLQQLDEHCETRFFIFRQLITLTPIQFLLPLIFILSSIWIPHQTLDLLEIRHPRRSGHILQVVTEGGPIPPDFVLVQRIHNARCINVRADLDHLVAVPACHPHVDNVKVIPCSLSATPTWTMAVTYQNS